VRQNSFKVLFFSPTFMNAIVRHYRNIKDVREENIGEGGKNQGGIFRYFLSGGVE